MPLDLQAIKEREKSASRGPWKVYKNERVGVGIGTEYEHPQLKSPNPIVTTALHREGEAIRIYISKSDADFIANARQDVPALITEVESLRNALQCIQDICDASEHIRTNIDLSLVEDIAFDALLESDNDA